MSRTTVLIADDHPIFRRGLRDIIEDSADFRVVAEAGDGISARRQIELTAPDIAVIDLAMPRMDGFELVAWAGRHRPALRCVIMTMYTEDEFLDRALELGAAGYLIKEDANDELLRCLQVVRDGGRFVSPTVGRHRPRLSPTVDAAIVERLARLTPAQRRIMKYVGQYKTSKEIGRILNISYRTVQNHRANICRELDLEGPNSLIEFAVRYGDLIQD